MLQTRLIKRLSWLIFFCLIGAGNVLSQGLSGEYVITSRWRDLFSQYSPLTNPALLTEENYTSIRGAFSTNTAGGFNFWEMGATVPIGLDQSVGFTWLGEDDGDVQQAQHDANGEIIIGDPATTSQNLNSFFMGSYAYNIWDGLSLGINVNFGYQSNFGKPLLGLGLDLGATYRALLDPVWGTHIFGAAIQNIIPPAMSSSNLLDVGNLGAYSRNLRLSWNSNYWEHRIESGLDFNFRDLFANSAEYKYSDSLNYELNYRLGFNILHFINIFGLTGFSKYGFDYWGLAAGVNVPQVNNGRDFSFIYQFLSLSNPQTEIITPMSHSFYMRIQFGQHREENYAERMARSVDLAPSDLYNKACKLYFSGKYWDAFFVFSQISVQYPSFFKSDWVNYYKASCLEYLDMREEAADGYVKVKQEYPRSAIIPYANLGQMRIFYRDDAENSVYNQFSLLNKPETADSLKYHAFYLMGETYLKQKNYQPAIELFSQIPETHPDYIFAQHSLGISQILSLKMDDALNALGNCIEAKAQTDPQKEIINRSYVLLGYIFYEQMALSKAVTALRMVPKSSYYYEDALLGLCWTALRARQWNDCITMAQSLQKSTAKPPLQCDAGLIEGYAHLMLKNYKQAFDVLQGAQNKVQNYHLMSTDSLDAQKNAYRTNRKSYGELSGNVDNIGKELQSSYVLQQIDSLHKVQEGDKKKLDDYYRFTGEFDRQKFFSRNIDVIKGDIEYAMAISQKLSQQSTKSEVQEQMQNKQKELDDQIDKLKKEMNKLNDKK